MENQATLIKYQASSDARYKVRKDIPKTEQAMLEEQLISVRDWSCSTKAQSIQDRYESVRAYSSKSGAWLLNNKRMKTWMNVTSSSIPLL